MRAYLDLLAYGSHYPTCRLHETVATNRPHLPDLHPHPCSCGFKDAVNKAQRAAQPAPDLDPNLLQEAINAAPIWDMDDAPLSMEQAELVVAEYARLLQARESGGEP